MNVNALVGYLLVEISAIVGKAAGLLPGNYKVIIALSSIVNPVTIIIIIILCSKKKISRRSGLIIFVIEYFVYLGAFAAAIFFLDNFRVVGMIFAIVAITIELPFTTLYENIAIVFGSFFVYMAVSLYAILQGGSVPREFLYIVCAVPAIFVIAYVSRQINQQRTRIETGKIVLEEINDKLVRINNDLRRSRDMSARDITLASHIQKAFLPETPKDLVDWDIAVYFCATRGVSGDCYDFYQKEKTVAIVGPICTDLLNN